MAIEDEVRRIILGLRQAGVDATIFAEFTNGATAVLRLPQSDARDEVLRQLIDRELRALDAAINSFTCSEAVTLQ